MFNQIGPTIAVDVGLTDAAVPDPNLPPGTPPVLEMLSISFVPTTDAHPPGIDGTLHVDLTNSLDITLGSFGDDWRFAVQLGGALAAGLGVRMLPPASLTVTSAAKVEGDFSLGLIGQASDPTTPFLIFGETGGSRLEATLVRAGLIASLEWDAVNSRAAADAGFEVKVTKANLVVDTSNSDGFLQKLLPPPGLNANFAFDLGWTAARGFFFSGSASLEHAFALNLAVGPFHVDTLHLVIDSESGELTLEASIDGGGTLGPIAVSIERIGVDLDLKFSRGNLGPVDLGVGFKFPTGLGLSIDAGPITGGGFIEYDPSNGRYSNVLSLSCYGITVNAIALLDTRLPGGESGFSFLILISGQFTPIQLGFGFTLNGVGGLCGINRDFVSSALQAGLRAHSLDHILFPQDPIANAPAIISDLRSIFPPVEGRYVFGPMAELGWGGGLNLVTAELGILLTLPSPVVIAILGQLDVVLPNQDAPLVVLHLDVLGTIDFGKKLFSLDATLHNSRIVQYTVFGDMAMRLGWGDNSSFALSIGGLNPHFQPPDDFPQLKRLTISLSASDSLQLTVQSYFAITSNTFQIGAKCELQAGAGSYNVYGWLDFDALFMFTPFSFTVDFTAGLALRSGTSTLFGISVDGELSGTSPWHVHGEAHISLLFFDLSVSVDYTRGDAKQISAPPVDAWPQLQAALQDVQNWSGSLPASVPAPVTLSTPSATAAQIFVDPSGVLTLRERVLPLNQTLSKFGEAVPGPQTTFTLDQVQLGGQPLSFSLVTDKFAPAQFEQMSDQDKLSRPSFDDGVAGFSVGEGQLAFGQQFGLDLAYVDIYVDDHAPPPLRQIFRPTLLQQINWARSNQASRSGLTIALGKFAPSGAQLVTLAPERFVVATVDELTQRADITAPVSKGEAYRALQAHLTNHPDEQGQLQVLPLYELAA